MHRSLLLAVVLIVGAFALNSNSRTVRLKAGHIDTTKAPSLDTLDDSNTDHLLTEARSSLWKAAVPGRSGYLVHVDRDTFNKREVEAVLGVELTEYLPHNTFLVYAPHDLVKSLSKQVKGVLWTAHYGSHYKMEPNTRRLLSNPVGAITVDELPKSVSLVVNTFAAVDSSELKAAIEQQFMLSGCELHIASIADGSRLEVTVRLGMSTDSLAMHTTAGDIMEFLADYAEVKWVEMRKKIETKNKYARVITQTGAADVTASDDFTTALYTGGIDGSGVIIGVGDTGVDASHCSFYDEDVTTPFDKTNKNHRKIVHYETFVDDGDYEGGHGSHVSGSVLGHPTDDGEEAYAHSGMAPEAKLWFFDIGDSDGNLNVPLHLGTQYFPGPRNDNVHIHSNSWGCAGPAYGAPDFCNQYDSECQDVDAFIYDNPDFLVLIAAGNDGDTTRYGSVGSPAVAKNALTVGAASNSYYAWTEYGTEGMDPSGLSYFLNEDVMAYFSSTGPTFDGRIKPEIVAPGHEIMSVNADGSTSTSSITCGLQTMSGTSMATPVTAGNVGLVQQFFQDGFYPMGTSIKNNAFYPSAALLKAVMINGATPMSGVQRFYLDPLSLPVLDDQTLEADLTTVTASGLTWGIVSDETVQIVAINSALHLFRFTTTSGNYIKISLPVPFGDLDLYADTSSSFANGDLFQAEELSATYGDEHIFFPSPGSGVNIYVVVEPWAVSVASLKFEMSSVGYTSVPTLGCSDTFVDVQTSIAYCPTDCTSSSGVYGERFYDMSSSVCAAAKHQGVITSEAPFNDDYQYVHITVYGYPTVDGFIDTPFNWTLVGSTRNGIVSEAGTAFNYVMTFNVAGGDVNEVDYAGFEEDVPNPSSGFGRVNLLNTIALAGQSSDRYITILTDRNDDSIDDGDESISYTVDNSATTGVLKFTLVWTDPEASEATDMALVNNLDLMVTTSDCVSASDDGAEFYGNGGTALNMDMVNNVEQVVVLDPRECTYTVMVMATDVPSGPQDFALVAGGYDFVQTGDVDVFDEVGEDVTGWGGPESAAASVRPVAAIVAVLVAAVAALL